MKGICEGIKIKKGEKPLTFTKSRPLKAQYLNELCSLELNQLKRHKKRRPQHRCPFGRDYSLGKAIQS